MLDEIALHRNANVMVASHNEETVKHTLSRYRVALVLTHAAKKTSGETATLSLLLRMNELGMSPRDNKVYFGQLLGMCDQISFPLGESSAS